VAGRDCINYFMHLALGINCVINVLFIVMNIGPKDFNCNIRVKIGTREGHSGVMMEGSFLSWTNVRKLQEY